MNCLCLNLDFLCVSFVGEMGALCSPLSFTPRHSGDQTSFFGGARPRTDFDVFTRPSHNHRRKFPIVEI